MYTVWILQAGCIGTITPAPPRTSRSQRQMSLFGYAALRQTLPVCTPTPRQRSKLAEQLLLSSASLVLIAGWRTIMGLTNTVRSPRDRPVKRRISDRYGPLGKNLQPHLRTTPTIQSVPVRDKPALAYD